jgi:hypothetical protein
MDRCLLSGVTYVIEPTCEETDRSVIDGFLLGNSGSVRFYRRKRLRAQETRNFHAPAPFL